MGCILGNRMPDNWLVGLSVLIVGSPEIRGPIYYATTRGDEICCRVKIFASHPQKRAVRPEPGSKAALSCLKRTGQRMAYWVWYRKGSFALKEQFDCRRLALSRASDLVSLVGTVEVIDPGKIDGRIHALLERALEFNAAAGKLVLFSAPVETQR
jgi:hypothetical protein